MTETSPGRRWRWVRAALPLALLIAVLTATTATSGGPTAAAVDPMSKVEAAVFDQLASGKGTATFWAIMAETADLGGAEALPSDARGQFVYDRLTTFADLSQAGLRALLTERGAPFKPFWIVNTIQITGDEALLREVAARPEVAQVLADGAFEIPDPIPAGSEPTVDVVEWNIARVRAPEVWTGFGVRGEGIVVANIDTGAQFNHTALVRQYRGTVAPGVFDHNYNWHDPSRICGNPSLVPCDNNGHGTHTMGTMVGDDGDPGPNQIGVAPHARWIAAKGCESSSCSFAALLSSGQWVLAPTDLNGQNPRPDLRPHAVNNSWGGGPGNPFFQQTVDSWVASGIFPAFSNGNSGPSCATSGSPGDYVNTYSAGAFDIGNNIAVFSSRGPSAFAAETKPNIAAPGVAVRSSVPTNSYASFSGTSMASPHVAAAVALMWSAAPAIERSIAATRTLLDDSSVDTADLTCGGTIDDNNVWGEGKLDAFAAVDQSPRGPTGTLTGMVTDASTGLPMEGATVRAVGPMTRSTVTDLLGRYTMTLGVGSYTVTASKFGFRSQTATGVVISEGQTTTQNFSLQPAQRFSVSGHVRDEGGNAMSGATVTILNTPIAPTTTDESGAYSFADVPEGEYDVRAEAGRCNDPQTQHLVVDGNETLDFALPQRFDSFGYFCQTPAVSYIEASTVLPISGDDASIPVNLPFSFTLYGRSFTTAHVSTNGFLNFLAPNATFSNGSIPSTAAPNAAIYPYWDDLFVDGQASMRTETLGAAPNRRFVIEWRNVHFFGDTTRRVDFEVVLHENGRILTQYRNIANDARERGNSATLGIENDTGTVAFQYSFNEATIASPEFAILYRIPPSAFVQGTVTDANDGQPVAGAAVRALAGGVEVRRTTTDASGFYRMQLRLGTYTIEASKQDYSTESATVVLDVEDATVVQDFSLRSARSELTPASLEFLVPVGQTRTKTLVLRNTGTLDMEWELKETGGGRVSVSTAEAPRNPDYDPSSATTEGLYVNDPEPVPAAPGDVIRSWPPTGLQLAWGVGFTGQVWLSDIPNNDRNHEFTVTGAPTGRSFATPWAGVWPGDMALDTRHDCMAQVNVGGDNGIYCWSLDDGSVVYSITGSFPWTTISQRGLAYRADDDTFYIGGWNQLILYRVKGNSHPDKGAVVSQCRPSDGNISGLAWNPAAGVVWEATNSPSDTIYQLNPETCATISTLAHPSPGFDGAGLEMDEAGNLWMIDQDPNTVYLIDSGVPAFTDVPWLAEDPSSGTLAVDGRQEIRVTADATGLEPGVYQATLFLTCNCGRQSRLSVPVRMIVPAYFQGVNAGGAAYTDGSDDPWSADRLYTAGSFGYTSPSSNDRRTTRNITGTIDDPLYQSQRVDPVEYRFDGVPAGVYEIDLRFAEIQGRPPNTRLFDVIVEGDTVLPAHDIAAEVGNFAADDHVFFRTVGDGQLNIRFVARRGYAAPVVNAIQVVHRPDR